MLLGLACRLELCQNSAPCYPQQRSDDEATRPNEDHIVGYEECATIGGKETDEIGREGEPARSDDRRA